MNMLLGNSSLKNFENALTRIRDGNFKEASARLFAWIVDQEDWSRLQGFPCVYKRRQFRSLMVPTAFGGEPPLATDLCMAGRIEAVRRSFSTGLHLG